MIKRTTIAMTALGIFALAGAAQATDIAIDGGLEAAGVGGFPVNPPPGMLPPGWVGFTSNPANSVGTTSTDPFDGTYAAELTASEPASNAILKNANIGIGTVQANSEVTISFWARGSDADGGVQFAEFFSELAGGGVSKSEILGGAPLFVGSDWSFYEFTTTTGSDVSGGVTVQFAAITGGTPNSFSQLYIDNLVVEVAPIPVPAAGLLLSSALGLLGLSRRRKA
jgi:hypothetical protein